MADPIKETEKQFSGEVEEIFSKLKVTPDSGESSALFKKAIEQGLREGFVEFQTVVVNEGPSETRTLEEEGQGWKVLENMERSKAGSTLHSEGHNDPRADSVDYVVLLGSKNPKEKKPEVRTAHF